MSRWSRPLAKLISALILLPAVLVYFHFRRVISTSNYCFIGPAGKISSIKSQNNIEIETTDKIKTQNIDAKASYGIYSLQQSKSEIPSFHQLFSSSWSSSWISQYGWPSAPILASELIFPSSNLSSMRKKLQQMVRKDIFVIEYQSDGKRWCLLNKTHSKTVACSDSQSNDPTQSFPTSGFWSSTSSLVPSLHIACPTSALPPPQGKKNRKQKKQNKNVEFVVSKPTTTFLLFLNIGLAYYYWNYRISPSIVAKNYDRIMNQNELWRSFTGALAHFEPLHLGFNMMSLVSLGEALEQWGYGSLPFLSYNFSLIIYTTTLMMLITKLRILRAKSSDEIRGLKEQNTVGYSGVLFAWMTVVSMEQQKSCPVFFLPEMCFSSFSIYKDYLKFNISPLVTLVAMQLILPRVSFVGHLSGIVCGFLLHWGILRLEFCLPHVLGCLMTVIWLWKIEKVIPAQKESVGGVPDAMIPVDITSDGEDEPNETRETMKQVLTNFFSQQATVQEKTKSYLQMTCYGLIGVCLLSSLLFDHGIVFAQAASAFVFYSATRSFLFSEGKQQKYSGVGHLFRGYVITSLLLILVDSMSLPGWWVARVFIFSSRVSFVSTSIFVVIIIALLRIILNLWGLILAVKVLADIGELSGGSFYKNVLSWVVGNCRIVGDVILAPMYRAFEGQGTVLGAPRDARDELLASIGTGFQRTV